jgi:TPR repeat protein
MALKDRLLGALSPASGWKRAKAMLAGDRPAEAVPLLIKAATAGIPEAEYRLGRAYLEGRILPPSRTEAMRWLIKGGEHGQVEAQTLLAGLYVNGMAGADPDPSAAFFETGTEPAAGAEPNFDKALVWAKRAAEAGALDAQTILGFIYSSGPDSIRDLEAAHEHYRQSAEGGSAHGALGYAISLARLEPTPEGHAKAAVYLRQAADAEIPTALFLLAVVTEDGLGVERDQAAAAQLYRQAAERGNSNGQARWGMALLQGRGVARNPTEGESWLRRAALAGDMEAAAVIGDLYARGGELPPNYAEAAMWFRRAASAGHSGAARALGLLHLTGAGVPRDADEAALWFRAAADAGDRVAQADFANLVLRHGTSNTEDLTRTRQWFEEAALKGDHIAAFNFGVCLAEGVGAEKNEVEAVRWLRMAAERVVNAQFWYGRMLLEGRGVAADAAEARIWIGKAAEIGMVDAQVLMAELLVNGKGGPPDHPAALALFQSAAAKGHTGAMFGAAAMQGGGHSVPVDLTAAQTGFRNAAEHGHKQAQLMLGRYLARGLVESPNPAEARQWLEKALAQGLTEAEADLAELPVELGIEPGPGFALPPKQVRAS